MIKYVIHGGKPLQGKVQISGAKNAAVGILPATLLVKGICRIENVPDISDIRLLLQILQHMGASVRRLGDGVLEVDCTNVHDVMAPDELVNKIRASYYFIGAQLGRFGHVTIALPGGCHFAKRPIDQHEKGFQALGTDVAYITDEALDMTWFSGTTGPEGLVGSRVNLDVVSVGATMNIMIGAVLAKGTTYIESAAKEPHVVDLANFLNAMGAKISGAGTDVIRIKGVKALHGGFYSIIPDQIEAGTYMAAAAAVELFHAVDDGCLCDFVLADLRAHLPKLGAVLEPGVVDALDHAAGPLGQGHTDRGQRLHIGGEAGVRHGLHRGPAQPFGAADPDRVLILGDLGPHLPQLGGDGLHVLGDHVLDEHVPAHGSDVEACDLRAGAAMVVAGLAAEGTTVVLDAHFIERGYENMIQKLRALGADITRVETAEQDDFRPAS